ncbi:MAG TPA: FAD-dependent oxidoreductase, partial [Opitutus sp.]|nr:FAD-dependent oxidoreductase [Opitutus sp.]
MPALTEKHLKPRSPRAVPGRTEPPPPVWHGRPADLAGALRAKIRGEVRFDDGARALYATDASNYRMPPIGVVVPLDRNDIITAVKICREHGSPILSRGGGTSLAGQCCNTAVVLDLSKYYHRILALDPARRLATVEPGIVLD